MRASWTLPIAAIAAGLCYLLPADDAPAHLRELAAGVAVLVASISLLRDGLPPLLRLRLAPELLLLLALLDCYGGSLLLEYRPELWREWFGTPPPQSLLAASGGVAVIILLVRGLVAHMSSLPARKLRARLALLPDHATVFRQEQDWQVPVEQIVANEIVTIAEGERLAFDGIVLESKAYLDESPLTGDDATATKGPGEMVYAGSRNQGHGFRLQVQALGDERALPRYVALVEAGARRYRAGVDSPVSSWISLIVLLLLALGTAAYWAFLGEDQLAARGPFPWTMAWWSWIALLLAGAPWALSTARAVGYAVARASAAELGALLASNESLPRLAKLSHLCLDKTGTLTTGWPRLTDIEPLPGFTPHELLGVCAKAEYGSRHPLALAIAAAAAECGIPSTGASEIEFHAGMGVEAMIDGKRVVVGSPLLLEQLGVDMAPFQEPVARMSAQGRSPLAVAIDGKGAGVLSGGAELRSEAPQWLAALRSGGIEPVLLSGDQEPTVAALAGQLGISEFHAEWKPEQKADYMRELSQHGKQVGFAAHVSEDELLEAAPLSIAVGTAPQLQARNVDVALPGKQLGGACRLLVLLRAVDQRLRQLLVGLIVYMLCVLPLAAGLLRPSTGLYLPPEVAIGLSGILTLVMALQALSLRRLRTGF